jgi:ABC-type transport system involved in cytochrome c biogenesis permease subunit
VLFLIADVDISLYLGCEPNFTAGAVSMHSLALLLQQPNQAAAAQAMMAMMTIFPIIMLVCLAVVIIPTWFICKKAGFSPWLSLLNIVPLGSLILLYVLAFAEWKTVPAPAQAAYYPPPPAI